jgi:uncharacterized protein YjbI with pentapeptide repeats
VTGGLEEFRPGGYCFILGVGFMTREELLERYAAGKRTFGRIVLRNSDLREANLTGSDLSGSDLSGSRLQRANLSGANLSGIEALGVNLTNANLTGCDVNGADLTGADFTEANLTGADMYCCLWDSAYFYNTILTDGNLVTEPTNYD